MSEPEAPDLVRMDEASLHAYVDGQLGPAERAEVQAWLLSHPEDAQRVGEWQAQRAELAALHLHLLDEALPEPVLKAARGGETVQPVERAMASSSHAWQALAAGVLLSLGLGGGWVAHDWWGQDASAAQPLAANPATRQRDTPGFVRDAAIAHAVYMPEQRHPVEVGAEQQDHLVQWLSKRLGQRLRVPDLGSQGFALVGGRLLPAGQDGGAGSLSRAQFMYQNPAGERLTLYVSVLEAKHAVPPAFALDEHGNAAKVTRSYYWIDGQLGYALSGQFSAELLARAGAQVYAQLQL